MPGDLTFLLTQRGERCIIVSNIRDDLTAPTRNGKTTISGEGGGDGKGRHLPQSVYFPKSDLGGEMSNLRRKPSVHLVFRYCCYGITYIRSQPIDLPKNREASF